MDMLSLATARQAADERVTGFRRVFGVILGLEALTALALMVLPDLVFGLLSLAAPGGAPASGAVLLWAVLLQLPGLLNPVHNRMPVVLGIIGRSICGLVFLILGGPFLLLGSAVILFVVILFLEYSRMVMAVLMSRP